MVPRGPSAGSSVKVDKLLFFNIYQLAALDELER